MSQKCTSSYQREGIRANIIDLLYEQVKSGNYCYLQKTNCQDEYRYNYIIDQLEDLKKNKTNQNYQRCLIQKILTTTKWTAKQEAEIKGFYNQKQANVICERLRIIHKRDQILKDVMVSLRQYNSNTKINHSTSDDSVKQQVCSLINKIYLYQEAIKIISEYPTNVNMDKFKEFNNQRAGLCGQMQKSNFENVYWIKETIRTIEKKLQPFRTIKNNNGFIHEQLIDKIVIPCQNLIQIRKQAQKSLTQLCTFNTSTKFQSINNSIIPLKNIIEVLSKQQIKMKETIANLNQKIQQTLGISKFPFVKSEPSISITRSIDNMRSKLDSIYEIVNYYSIFGDRILDLRVKSEKGHNQISSLRQCEYKFGNPSMETKKELWKKKLQNNLKFLKDQLKIDIQVQIKQQKHQSPKQIKLDVQIETETSVNKLSQEQQQSSKTFAQLYDQNSVLINRWQTVWVRLKLDKNHNNYIDRLKIPLKGQNDQQLQVICDEIQKICKFKQTLRDITGEDVLSYQSHNLIKKNIQFLIANLDISQQIYKDKQSIQKFILIENNLKKQIDEMNNKYKDLQSQYQVFRELLDKLFEKIQQIKKQFNLAVLIQQSQSKYQQIPFIMNYLKSNNIQIHQRCKILQQQNICIKEEQKLLKNQLEGVKISKKTLEIEKEQVINSLKKSQSQIKQQLNIKQLKISQLVKMQETLDTRNKKIQSQHTDTIKKLNIQKFSNQSNTNKITQLSHELQRKNQALFLLLLLKQHNNRQLERKQADLFKTIDLNLKLKQALEAIKFQSLFNIKGQIYNKIHAVNAIKKEIEVLFNRNIKYATNLLFLDKRMIQIKPKIDSKSLCGHQHNFLVIKTANKVIGCLISTPLSLTSQKIIHKPVEKSFLLVGNEGNCQVYYQKEQNKLNFDINSVHSQISIGRSDLLIDLIEGKITSNMGQNETQFDSKGKKGKEIFGGDNLAFESLEFYKVQFQEKQNQQYFLKCKIQQQIYEKKNAYSTLQIKSQDQYNHQVEADYTRFVQPQFQQKDEDFLENVSQKLRQIYQKLVKQFQQKICSHIDRYLQPIFNLKVIEKKLANLKNSKKEGELQIKLLSQSQDQYKQHCFNLQKKIDELKILNQDNRNKQQNYQSSLKIIENYKKSVQDLNTFIRNQKAEISKLSTQLQTTKSELEGQQLLLESFKLKMSMNQQETIQSNKTDQAQLQNYKRKFQEQKRKFKDLSANKQRQINCLQKQLRQIRDKVEKLQNDYMNSTKQIKQKNLNISELKKQIEHINKTIKNNQSKKSPEANLRQVLEKQISSKYLSQFEAHKKKLTKLYAQRWSNYPSQIKEANFNQIYLTYIDRFFQGELLQDKIILKYCLMYHIQKLSGMPILRTRLIYNFDLRNKANFNIYIHKVQSLLCIIKLKSGVFLAGYYTGEYLQGPMTQPGLLINLTKNESYFLNVAQNYSKTSYRAMLYDPYFIIFGNAEIRIKAGQNILFSNFGIANSYFNSNNKKLVDFIGENKREVQLESYEIYQVLFNNTFDDNE